MEIRIMDGSAASCCGDTPSLNTWDEKELRSIRCVHCGRRTPSLWGRAEVFEEWNKMMRSVDMSNQGARRQPGKSGRGFETVDFAKRRQKNRAKAKMVKASRKKNR